MNSFSMIVFFLSGLLVSGVLINLLSSQQLLNQKALSSQDLINVLLIIDSLKSIDYEAIVNYSLAPGRLIITNDLITIVRGDSFSAGNPDIKIADCFFNSSLLISKESVNCA